MESVRGWGAEESLYSCVRQGKLNLLLVYSARFVIHRRPSRAPINTATVGGYKFNVAQLTVLHPPSISLDASISREQ